MSASRISFGNNHFKVLNILIFPGLLYLITYWWFGFYFGWMDDIVVCNVLQGTFTGKPSFNLFEQFLLIKHVFKELYQFNSDINWYGIFLYTASITSTVCLFAVIHFSLSQLNVPYYIISLILVLFYFAFLLENTFLINYTRVAILLTGGALLWLMVLLSRFGSKIDILFLSAAFCLFVIGYQIRAQVGIFSLSPVLLAACLYLPLNPQGAKKFILLTTLTLLTVGGFHCLEKQRDEPNYIEFKRIFPYISNLLDADNVMEHFTSEVSQEDSIRLMAIGLWYFSDEEQITVPFLESLSEKSLNHASNAIRWKERIGFELNKSKRYTADYHQGYNYFIKICAYSSFQVAVIIFFLVSFLKNGCTVGKFIKISCYPAFFLAVLFSCMVFFKMEDRVLTPFFIIHMIGYLLIFSTYEKMSSKLPILIPTIIILSCLVVITLRFPTLIKISHEKKEELAKKSKLIAEVNSRFVNQIIMYDLWSMTFIHGTPFQVVKLSDKNTHIAYGEYFVRPYQFYKDDAIRVCETDKLAGFYDCLCRKKDDVVFLFSDFRAQLIPDYFKILYGKKYVLKEIPEKTELNDIKHSFLWEQVNYGYYRFESCN